MSAHLFSPPSPDTLKQIEAYRQAAVEHDIAWRKVITGPWAGLFCTCYGNGPERCRVHGVFLLTPDGTVL